MRRRELGETREEREEKLEQGGADQGMSRRSRCFG